MWHRAVAALAEVKNSPQSGRGRLPSCSWSAAQVSRACHEDLIMSIITASKLTRRFGPLTAVDRLDLDVAAGEIFAVRLESGRNLGAANDVIGNDVAEKIEPEKRKLGKHPALIRNAGGQHHIKR